MAQTHKEFAANVRALADFVEAHTELPVPSYLLARSSSFSATPLPISVIRKAAGDAPIRLQRFTGDSWDAVINAAESCEIYVGVDTSTLIPVGKQVITNSSYELPPVEAAEIAQAGGAQ